ncbi:MAG: substrate-binding periplasmic protein [Fidelibacterota bacterium]
MILKLYKQIILVTIFLLIIPEFLPADVIKIGISHSIPPYVIKEENKGIELEILQTAFACSDHEVVPVYLPLARTFSNLADGQIDGAINIKEGIVKDVFYTPVVIRFNNCAISLKKKNYPDTISIDFLKDKHVLAFQQAHTLLGDEFRKMAENNEHYYEYAHQANQVYRLFLERDTDLIVLERRIFDYLRKKARDEIGDKANKPVTYHYIFPPTEYRFAFRQKKIWDDFNKGLETIIKNGTYQKILQKYTDSAETQ